MFDWVSLGVFGCREVGTAPPLECFDDVDVVPAARAVVLDRPANLLQRMGPFPVVIVPVRNPQRFELPLPVPASAL